MTIGAQPSIPNADVCSLVYAQKQNYYRIQLSFPYLVFHSFFKKIAIFAKYFKKSCSIIFIADSL